MRSIVVLVTLMLAASTPAAAETPAEAKILGGMVLTQEHRSVPPDGVAMRAPPSRPEYAGYVFFVPRSDVALAKSEGWRALTDAETEAWLKKKFDDAAAEEEERSAAGRSADRWRIATLLLGAVALVTTALAAWLVARRRAAG